MNPLRQLSMVSARKALELGPENSGTHWVLAFILLIESRWDESAKEYEISLRLNPNDADAWANFGDLKTYEGREIEAIACIQEQQTALIGSWAGAHMGRQWPSRRRWSGQWLIF